MDVTEKEVLALGVPFGCVLNALVTKNGQVSDIYFKHFLFNMLLVY